MKRTPPLTMLFGIVIAAALVMSAPGCGRNPADEASATGDSEVEATTATTEDSLEAAPVDPAAPDENELRERELAVREREIAVREAELDRRKRELEARAATTAPASERTAPASSAHRDSNPVIAEPARIEPRAVLVTLDAGTPLTVEIDQVVSSETSLVGDPVDAFVVSDVVRGTRVIVPAGSRVRGSVSDVVAQRKIGGQARLAIDFDRLITPAGQEVPMQARFEAVGQSQKKKDAATIGGSAAGGALLGRVLSEDDRAKGTVLGAVVGAAVGTAVASKNKADPVVIEPGLTVELVLVGPIEVAVAERSELAPVARN